MLSIDEPVVVFELPTSWESVEFKEDRPLTEDQATNVQSFCKEKWRLKNVLKDIDIPAIVPGQVHLDLLANEIINEPYYGRNDTDYRWISEQSWSYTTKFVIIDNDNADSVPDFDKLKDIRLVFHGIDTIAEVRLNDKLILKTENQFVKYSASILNHIHKDIKLINTLEVNILSPLEYAKKKCQDHPYAIPDGFNEATKGEKWRNFIRKEQCSFSWDWGPCFATSGIWKNVELVFDYVNYHIESCSISTEPVFHTHSVPLKKRRNVNFVPLEKEASSKFNNISKSNDLTSFEESLKCWKVNVNLEINKNLHNLPTIETESPSRNQSIADFVKVDDESSKSLEPIVTLQNEIHSKITINFTLKSQSEVLLQTSIDSDVEFKHLDELVLKESFCIEESLVNKWWPNGLGKQPLYTIMVDVDADEKRIHSQKFTVGFKSIRLIQEPDAIGECFKFQVNGVTFFTKGTNFIPSDCFESRIDNSKLAYLLGSCKLANMNMVRVWGGGIYQRDVFYELCDKYGLLVWQECMFACALYPINKSFLKSVRTEVKQQINRLKSHVCIALWSGNNENQSALVNKWYPEVLNDPYRYSSDYSKLYVDIIEKEVLKTDTTHDFILSSPWNGVYDKKERIPRFVVADEKNYGDYHFYDYNSKGWDTTKMPKARFVSEYGHQSIPSYYTLLEVLKDYNISKELIYRNHHPEGPKSIDFQIKCLGLDLNSLKCNIIKYSNFSQFAQRKAIVEQTRYYMSLTNICSGALYWQLNDIWHAPTWSSIEYNNNWKLLHYGIRDVFAPVRIEFSEDSSYVNIISYLPKFRCYLLLPDSSDEKNIIEIINTNDDCYMNPKYYSICVNQEQEATLVDEHYKIISRCEKYNPIGLDYNTGIVKNIFKRDKDQKLVEFNDIKDIPYNKLEYYMPYNDVYSLDKHDFKTKEYVVELELNHGSCLALVIIEFKNHSKTNFIEFSRNGFSTYSQTEYVSIRQRIYKDDEEIGDFEDYIKNNVIIHVYRNKE